MHRAREGETRPLRPWAEQHLEIQEGHSQPPLRHHFRTDKERREFKMFLRIKTTKEESCRSHRWTPSQLS